MDLFSTLFASLARHGSNEAFFINGQGYTYSELAVSISSKRAWIRAHLPKEEVLVGLVGFDDLHTYASILALWAEGKAYLPIAPKAPFDRNQGIIATAGISTMFTSMPYESYPVRRTLRTDDLPPAAVDLSYVPCLEEELAYVLFTSGTTGQPKGVPITRANLRAFVEAFGALGITLTSSDRCLQMFELTFDVSVMSFVLPLLCGACVHTVPQSAIKYMYIAELLGDRKLTMAPMVPSVITYLRPYFDEIRHPDLKYCVFAGEALPLELTEEWGECAPNARIYNAYGPTEHTVVCSQYLFQRGGGNKECNGIIAIGKQMGASVIVVIDEDGRILPPGSKGELCLSGPQLTAGYWNDPVRTAQVMFVAEHQGVMTRFYRTGDLCLLDEEGDIMYLGRIDQQAKIQGFRVELGEVEHFARTFLKGANLAALAVQNELGITEIMLAIEGEAQDPEELLSFMRKKLPVYMIPTRVHFVPVFPLGSSGKTDRNALQRGLITTT
ncbi:MAG: AMP-binding protein [Flavobacteriales bacterium]|nr:AMP-binding protein [Flavobacteriales bacterium]